MAFVKFPHKVGFYNTLKDRVDREFERLNTSPRENWRIFLKSGFILTGYVVCYIALVFYSSEFWQAVIFAFLLSQFYVWIGTNIMHDGNHDAFSSNKTINRLAGYTLDFIGGSSAIWKYKHNILHHTYPNIQVFDDDLDAGGILRLSPHQPWKPWHRFQYLYFFLVYGFLGIYWIYYADYRKFFEGKIGVYSLPKFGFTKVFVLFATRIFYYTYAWVIPCFYHPFHFVLFANLFVLFITGFSLSQVFNLNHIMSKNTFPEPKDGVIENEWAIHQVETAVNYGTDNRFINWYTGGLNFQIEHHLFPKINHLNYPKIQEIVQKTCEEFQVEYVNYPTFISALKAHVQFLKELGKPDAQITSEEGLVEVVPIQ